MHNDGQVVFNKIVVSVRLYQKFLYLIELFTSAEWTFGSVSPLFFAFLCNFLLFKTLIL